MKLLIVDDDNLILKSLSLTLSRENDIEIVGCAADGAEALKVCGEQTPDIVLMDIRMPDGAGVLSANALKKLTMTENPMTENPALRQLTQREKDIARLVAQGLTNKEIAAQLFLSEGTVRNNIVVIMEKLCVTNRTQLGMAYYMER